MLQSLIKAKLTRSVTLNRYPPRKYDTFILEETLDSTM